ncbi:MAG: glycoside hydrolase [Acidobacteria bacterium]|nr:glycoside hydrolase [Acidobacteriota bacterium]MCI0723530.1 glycoside hydrolase [Acidobacteriota bacterium]
MPALTQAPNGNLLVAFSTEWEPFPWGGILKLVVSKDQGETWSKPRTLWRDEDPRVTIQVANGMQTLSNGDVLLPVTYCVVPKRPGVSADELRPSRIYDPTLPGYQREVRFLRSKDSGRSWSIKDPRLEKPWFRFGRLCETHDGRLIMSAEAAYFESRDYGKTWGPKVTISAAAFNETNVVQAANGTLFSLMRQDGELGLRRMFGTSFSSDGGKSWSQWRWSGVQGKMPDTLVLPSGRILLAVGAEGLVDGGLVMTTKNRNSFCALFLSDDNGQNWKRDIAFESASGSSSVVPGDSPVMHRLKDQVLVVMQGIDRSRAADPLVGYHVGMSLIGNVIEPVARR